MAELPPRPIPAAEFFEKFVPDAFAESGLSAGTAEVDLKLGVRLEGEGGGEWLLHLNRGALSVESGSRKGAVVTLRQSVDDWRGALWEGRGGAFGQQALAFFQPGTRSPETKSALAGGSALNPAALTQLQNLDGEIKMVVSGGAGGDWVMAVKLGPGDLPAEPTTTVTVSAEDADAMGRGELDPLQAFMAGRIQIAGDMTLMMQVQAIQMQAAASSPDWKT